MTAKVVACIATVARIWRVRKPRVSSSAKSRRRRRVLVTIAWPTAIRARIARKPARIQGSRFSCVRRSTSAGRMGRLGGCPEICSRRWPRRPGVGAGPPAHDEMVVRIVAVGRDPGQHLGHHHRTVGEEGRVVDRREQRGPDDPRGGLTVAAGDADAVADRRRRCDRASAPRVRSHGRCEARGPARCSTGWCRACAACRRR